MNASVTTRAPFGMALNGNQECRMVFYGEAPTEHRTQPPAQKNHMHENEMSEHSNDSQSLQIIKIDLHNARLLTYCDGKPISLPDFMAKLTECVTRQLSPSTHKTQKERNEKK